MIPKEPGGRFKIGKVLVPVLNRNRKLSNLRRSSLVIWVLRTILKWMTFLKTKMTRLKINSSNWKIFLLRHQRMSQNRHHLRSKLLPSRPRPMGLSLSEIKQRRTILRCSNSLLAKMTHRNKWLPPHWRTGLNRQRSYLKILLRTTILTPNPSRKPKFKLLRRNRKTKIPHHSLSQKFTPSKTSNRPIVQIKSELS